MTSEPQQELLTPGNRLKYIRQQARLSRTYIEKTYGLPAVTLKAWESGHTPISEKGLKRCIDIYRKEGVLLSGDWVMTGKGISPRLSVNIGKYFASDLNQKRIHEDAAQYEEDDIARMLREASFFKESYRDSVILMVDSDDMTPAYQAGDYVGGIFRYGKDIDSALNHDCIIHLQSGINILRRVFNGNREYHYNLACVNPQAETSEPIMFNTAIEAAAPVIWHRKPDITL